MTCQSAGTSVPVNVGFRLGPACLCLTPVCVAAATGRRQTGARFGCPGGPALTWAGGSRPRPVSNFLSGQVALQYCVKDMGSTVIEEIVVTAKGPIFMVPLHEIERLIRDAGFRPARRNTR